MLVSMWEAGVLRLIATWAHGDCGVQLDSEALQRNEYLYLGGASRWEARRFECPYLVLFVASEYLDVTLNSLELIVI